jgi:hypothetical protein
MHAALRGVGLLSENSFRLSRDRHRRPTQVDQDENRLTSTLSASLRNRWA